MARKRTIVLVFVKRANLTYIFFNRRGFGSPETVSIQSPEHFDIPETPLPLLADLTRISQAISNLPNNAAIFTPDGGEIRLIAREENGEAVAAVSVNNITGCFHRKMKLIQRRAYGFKNFHNYRLRVIAQCG